MAQYTLLLSFDCRQVTPSLAYEFVLKDNSDVEPIVGGPLAGTFNFKNGDKLFIQVMASSAAQPKGGAKPKDILKDFTVTDCTLLSVPATMTEPLSMFDASNACASVEGWEVIVKTQDADNKDGNFQRLYKRSEKPLAVVTKNGQWQISGYLSVVLTTADGKTRPQLYFFDPEGSAGDGGGWGP